MIKNIYLNINNINANFITAKIMNYIKIKIFSSNKIIKIKIIIAKTIIPFIKFRKIKKITIFSLI